MKSFCAPALRQAGDTARVPVSVRWVPLLLSLPILAANAALSGTAFAEGISIVPISTHASGIFRKSAAEIPSYCSKSQRVFMVNAESGGVDVFDLTELGELLWVDRIDAAAEMPRPMRGVNSAATFEGTLAVAIEADPLTDPGMVAFYDTANLQRQGALSVGSLPDMLTFSPDGRWLLVANEGEPNEDYTVDPEGSVTIVDLKQGINRAVVREANFRDWNTDGRRADEVPSLIERGLRVFGRVTLTTDPYTHRPATFSEDVEPEWIEICPDSRVAYVCLQEANAIAEIEIASATVTRIIPLGFKDHGQVGNELDVSDRDGSIRIKRWPGLFGVYQPDTIRLYSAAGRRYLVTANEGDSRIRPTADGLISGVSEGDYFSDEATLKDWSIAGSSFDALSDPADLGRLRLVRDLVDRHLDPQGRPTKLFAFGARSFSIFDAESGDRVYDSGSDFERITAERYPRNFNASNDDATMDRRSRAKGPEPEGIAIGRIDGRVYAFVGLERIGGIMIYDITSPQASRYVGYSNHRNFNVPQQLADGSANPDAGDSGIEGLIFIAADQSPTGTNLLVVGNETSGTTTVWEVRERQSTELAD